MDLWGRAKKALPWLTIVALVAVVAIPAGALATITWSSPKLGHAQPGNTWLDGPPAYAFTEPGGTDTLHATFESDKLPGVQTFPEYTCGSTTAPFMGAFYEKSTNGGTSWTQPLRLSSETANAEGHGIATNGTDIVTYYRELNCYYAYGAGYRNTPSVVYTRTSTDGGDTFLPPVRITAPKKQVADYPYLDADYDGEPDVIRPEGGNGPVSDLFVMSFTNSKNGYVKVAVSDDAGASWTKHNAGTTALKGYPGYAGNTAVAVTGDSIGVAWMDTGGKMKAAFSDDAGDTWDTPITLSAGDVRGPNGRNYMIAADGHDGRIGFAWTTGDEGLYEEFAVGPFVAGGGGPTTWATFPDSFTPQHLAGMTPMVALRGSNMVGVSYDGCRTANCATSQLQDLMWVESVDNGDTFSATQRIAAGAVGTSQMNMWPSIVWQNDSTRWVAYANWQGGYANYRVLIRSGTGDADFT